MISAIRCWWTCLLTFVRVKTVNETQQSSKKVLQSDRRSHSDSFLTKAQKGSITAEEVAKHNTREDCWVIIKDKVYDVTQFGLVHPGGSIIFTHGGRNATDVFSCFHSASSWMLLNKLYIGELKPEKSANEALAQDFRQLRVELNKQGLFKADWLFYIWRIVFNSSLLFTSIALLNGSNVPLSQLLMAAFVLAFFFQQSGWLAHDFCHHQVFKNRKWNNVSGYIFGTIMQGFCVDWWKTKHNTHHAVTNELDGNCSAVDPDIDTLPLLAWSLDMLKTLKNPVERALIKYQHYIFVPILLLARFSWAQQSWVHAFKQFLAGENYVGFLLLLVHYTWHLGIAFLSLPFGKAVLFLVVCQMLSGFMLALAFVQSHNGMEIHDKDLDFVTAQVISTRNISHSQFVTLFMGGLDCQIEHHLFPTMPRHNLRKAQVAVRKLCEKHGLPYEECTMAIGTQRVIKRLIHVAKHV